MDLTVFVPNVNHASLALDVRFVIDYRIGAGQEPEHTLFELIAPLRIGVSGHSLGGKVTCNRGELGSIPAVLL
jgi:hypothetical protein